MPNFLQLLPSLIPNFTSQQVLHVTSRFTLAAFTSLFTPHSGSLQLLLFCSSLCKIDLYLSHYAAFLILQILIL
ncbi:hypothetical protein Pint_21904 [Pistacia integerrima]|uniref:Uncharacterized protein n=1 Tax=Pistacia integerrima TaxID=434235 RepID=A0ACC0XF76_9ROSI|nr:hypothetical protein Pint_21904 [Pistacia integerrima]